MASVFRWLLLLVVLFVTATASAEEVTLSVGGAFSYDTNAFQRRGARVNGWRAIVTPGVAIERDQGNFNYDASYRASYRNTVTSEDEDTWSHFARVTGLWRPTPRTQINFSNSFVRAERSIFFSEAADDPDVPGAQEDDSETNQTIRNRATLSLTHSLSEVQSLTLQAQHSLIDGDSRATFDSVQFSGSAFTTYRWDLRNTFDLGGTASYSAIDGSRRQSGSRTTTAQIFGGWTHSFPDNWRFNVRGGPTMVRTKSKRTDADSTLTVPRWRVANTRNDGAAFDLDSCLTSIDGEDLGGSLFGVFGEFNGNPVGGSACNNRVVSGVNGEPLSDIGVDLDETTGIRATNQPDNDPEFTFFGEASLTKSFRHWQGTLSFRRTEQPSTRAGGSTSLSVVRGSLSWDPPGGWSARLTGIWSIRESLGESQVRRRNSQGFLLESARDSGFLGLDTDGNVRRIAEADGFVTRTESNAIDAIQWSVALIIERRLARNGIMTFDLRYRRENRKGDIVTENSNLSRLQGTVSVRLNLDPFEI